MDFFHDSVNFLNTILWSGLTWLLVFTGLFFTYTLRVVQIRLLFKSIAELFGSRSKVKNSLTPFQAFVTGLASRVGVGNIAGVAIAINLGGPGAVFWMWITAIIGMSSAYAESTLAQLFKVDNGTGHFRGGPAYYIQQGLNSRFGGICFALTLILAFGFVFNAVQANSIVAATASWGWHKEYIGIALVFMTAPIIFGGIKRVAHVAEYMVPIMALVYLLMTVYVILANLSLVPSIWLNIIQSAFGYNQAVGGITGGLLAIALQQGIKRGLFSNEAGMGSAPNAAAAAKVQHPVNQGLIQMLGVALDTMVVCSCTAAVILISGIYETPDLTGVQLTQGALNSQFGVWGVYFLAFLIFTFAFSTIIGNYAYAESNVQFINYDTKLLFAFRLAVLAMVYFGAVQKVQLVWDMADLAMGLMAVINLVAILLLAPIVRLLHQDFVMQLKTTKTPVFDISKYPDLAKKVQSKIWLPK